MQFPKSVDCCISPCIIFSKRYHKETTKICTQSHLDPTFFAMYIARNWLANLDRCWMADRLARRGLQHHPHMSSLRSRTRDDTPPLCLECPFSRQVWHEIISWLRMTCTPPSTLQESSDCVWNRAPQGSSGAQKWRRCLLLFPAAGHPPRRRGVRPFRHRRFCPFRPAPPAAFLPLCVGRLSTPCRPQPPLRLLHGGELPFLSSTGTDHSPSSPPRRHQRERRAGTEKLPRSFSPFPRSLGSRQPHAGRPRAGVKEHGQDGL